MVKFKYLSCSKPESGGRTGEDRGGQGRTDEGGKEEGERAFVQLKSSNSLGVYPFFVFDFHFL